VLAVLVNVTLFGNRVSAYEQDKMRSLGWNLIHYDWCPYEKRKFGHRDRHKQVKDEVKTQRKSSVTVKRCLRLLEAGRESWGGFPLHPSQKEPTPPGP
jgi:hypothetical protein